MNILRPYLPASHLEDETWLLTGETHVKDRNGTSHKLLWFSFTDVEDLVISMTRANKTVRLKGIVEKSLKSSAITPTANLATIWLTTTIQTVNTTETSMVSTTGQRWTEAVTTVPVTTTTTAPWPCSTVSNNSTVQGANTTVAATSTGNGTANGSEPLKDHGLNVWTGPSQCDHESPFNGSNPLTWSLDFEKVTDPEGLELQHLNAGNSTEIAEYIVRKHNCLRTKVSPVASNMLRMEWNHEAAVQAQEWATQCNYTHNDELNRTTSGIVYLF